MSDYLWAKLIWAALLVAGAFVAGLMGWLPGQRQRERKDKDRR
jgi:hypothetical protein